MDGIGVNLFSFDAPKDLPYRSDWHLQCDPLALYG